MVRRTECGSEHRTCSRLSNFERQCLAILVHTLSDPILVDKVHIDTSICVETRGYSHAGKNSGNLWRQVVSKQ